MPFLSNNRELLDTRLRQAALLLLLMANMAAFTALIIYARPAISTIFGVVNPFLVAIIVAYIFHPFITVMQGRFKLSRTASVVITYGIIMLITTGFIAVLLPLVYIQFRALVQSVISKITSAIRDGIEIFGFSISPEDVQNVFRAVTNNLDPIQAKAAAFQALDSGRILRDILLATLTGSIGFVAFAVFVAVISFYFLLDYAHVRPFLHVTLGRERENRFLALWNQIDKSLSGYLRGQIVVAAIVGTLYGAGLWFLGMNAYAILIGFIAGVGNLIPYIGPILAAIPALIWVFFADAYPAMDDKIRGLVLILLLNAVVQGLDGFVLHPRIAGQGAELHPLVIMLALIAGAQLGIGGMILAVPVTIVIRVLLEELWWKPLTRKRAEEGIFYSDLLAEHSKLPERYMPIPKTKSE